MNERESTGDADEPEAGSDESQDSETVDVSDTTAPSIGPNTKIEKDSPEERLARHDQSDKDAMGLDKRREVIGGRYSASPLRQVVTYVIVIVVLLGAGFGLKALATNLDEPPAKAEDRAPWTHSDKEPVPLQ